MRTRFSLARLSHNKALHRSAPIVVPGKLGLLPVILMCTVRPREYIEKLGTIAARYSIHLESITVVRNVKAWCEEHGVPETNDWRTGKTVRNLTTDTPLILLAEEITASMQSSVLSALEFYGYDVEQLRDPRVFLTHLFLHELAHAQFPSATERECDDWAFSQLAQMPANLSLNLDAPSAAFARRPLAAG